MSGELSYEAIHIDALQVRVYGDAAVTIGRVTMTTRTPAGAATEQFCYTAVYVRQFGQWQVVAEQANLLTP